MALIHIGGKSYELVHENRNGWNPEAFRNRFSEVLERYDFIIGDWGYNQLRLKGFFSDNHQKANKDCTFSGISDYINEYCNFGCAYFILEKKQGGSREPEEDDLDLNELPASVIRLDGMQLRAAAETAATAIPEELAGTEVATLVQSVNRHRYRSQPRSDGGAGQGQGRHGSGNGSEGRQQGGEHRQGSGEGRQQSGEHRQGSGEGRQQGSEGRRRDRDQHYRKGGGNRGHERSNEQRGQENRSGDQRGKKPVKTAATAVEPGRGNKDAGRS